jgi:hypothetical protein
MDGWMDRVVIGLFQLFFSYELNQVIEQTINFKGSKESRRLIGKA